jgi:Arc/MetJ family transcription regulator
MYGTYLLLLSRSTLNIDDELIKKAAELTGISKKSALIRMGLNALIERESARRLSESGGSQPRLSRIRRRRPLQS